MTMLVQVNWTYIKIYTPYTVKCLYFVSHTILRFLKIILYLLNYFWTKIMTISRNLYTSIIRTSVHKMTFFKYIKKAPNALPNPKDHLWHHTASDAISPANCKVSVLIHQDTGQKIKAIYMTQAPYAIVFLQTKCSFLHCELILIGLRLNMLDEVHTLHHGGMAAMLPFLGPIFPYGFFEIIFFVNQIFPLNHEIPVYKCSSQNINPLQYITHTYNLVMTYIKGTAQAFDA